MNSGYPQHLGSFGLSLEEMQMGAEGYKSWTFRPALIVGTATPTTQQCFYTMLPLRAGAQITGLDVFWSNTPSSLTVCKVGLYLASDLTQKAVSADVSSSANSYNGGTSGKFRTPFSSIFAVPETAVYYAALLCVGTGTFPTLGRGAASSGASLAATGGLPPWGFQGSLSDLPSSATIASASSPIWFGAY